MNSEQSKGKTPENAGETSNSPERQIAGALSDIQEMARQYGMDFDYDAHALATGEESAPESSTPNKSSEELKGSIEETPENKLTIRQKMLKKLGAATLALSMFAGGFGLRSLYDEKSSEDRASYSTSEQSTTKHDDKTVEAAPKVNEHAVASESEKTSADTKETESQPFTSVEYFCDPTGRTTEMTCSFGKALDIIDANGNLKAGTTSELAKSALEDVSTRYGRDPALVAAHMAGFGLISFDQVDNYTRKFVSNHDAWKQAAEQLDSIEQSAANNNGISFGSIDYAYDSAYFEVTPNEDIPQIRHSYDLTHGGNYIAFEYNGKTYTFRAQCGMQTISRDQIKGVKEVSRSTAAQYRTTNTTSTAPRPTLQPKSSNPNDYKHPGDGNETDSGKGNKPPVNEHGKGENTPPTVTPETPPVTPTVTPETPPVTPTVTPETPPVKPSQTLQPKSSNPNDYKHPGDGNETDSGTGIKPRVVETKPAEVTPPKVETEVTNTTTQKTETGTRVIPHTETAKNAPHSETSITAPGAETNANTSLGSRNETDTRPSVAPTPSVNRSESASTTNEATRQQSTTNTRGETITPGSTANEGGTATNRTQVNNGQVGGF